jgi:hypothetical protein
LETGESALVVSNDIGASEIRSARLNVRFGYTKFSFMNWRKVTGLMSNILSAAVLAALLALVGTLLTSWYGQSQKNREPFLTKQLELCFEASDAASRLATEPDPVEWEKARRSFWRLYWGVLSIVEDPEVERAMVKLGDLVPPKPISDVQLPAESLQDPSYELAHAIRRLLLKSWNINLPPLDDKRTK